MYVYAGQSIAKTTQGSEVPFSPLVLSGDLGADQGQKKKIALLFAFRISSLAEFKIISCHSHYS